MIFNKEFETMERAELTKLQGKRLNELIARVYEKVPFYKKRIDEKGIKPPDIAPAIAPTPIQAGIASQGFHS